MPIYSCFVAVLRGIDLEAFDRVVDLLTRLLAELCRPRDVGAASAAVLELDLKRVLELPQVSERRLPLRGDASRFRDFSRRPHLKRGALRMARRAAADTRGE